MTRFDPVKNSKKQAEQQKPATSRYTFRGTPTKADHSGVTPKMLRKARIGGVLLTCFAVGGYLVAMSRMKQEDFSDVVVPEKIVQNLQQGESESK